MINIALVSPTDNQTETEKYGATFNLKSQESD